ncbi:MAG: DUF3971 domain-containing protein [Alphaproteobacteria bacterium]|nr:DUF3971 domain-containing protein [Alphaproteobacteria bacterium]
MLHLAFELCAVLLLGSALALGAFLWHVSRAPVDVTGLRPYVEKILSNPESGNHAAIDQMLLYWPDMKSLPYLGLKGARILDKKDVEILSVDEAAISFSLPRLLVGKISPETLILKQPSLRVVRGEDGLIDIGFRGQETDQKTAESQSSLTAQVLEYIARPGRADNPNSPLGSLRALEVEGAKIHVEDRILKVSWFLPSTDIDFRSAKEGLESSFMLHLSNDGEPVSWIRGQLLLDWNSKGITLETSLKNFDTKILAKKIKGLDMLTTQDVVINATITASFGPNLSLETGEARVESPDGILRLPDLFKEAAPYTHFFLQASYGGKPNTPKKLQIAEAGITLKGITALAEGGLEQNGDSLKGPLTIKIGELRQEKITELWPEFLRGDHAEEWLIQKIKGGVYRNLSAEILLDLAKGDQGWKIGADDLIADFSFEGMTVNYRPPLTPITNSSGSGRYEKKPDRLSINIQEANLGNLVLQEGDLEFTELSQKGKGYANIQTKMNGPLEDLFAYVEKEPLHMNHDFDLSRVAGNVDLSLGLSFPAIKNLNTEDLKISAEGKIHGAVLPHVVRNLDLSEGSFAVQIAGNDFGVKGEGVLEGRPVSIEYSEFLQSEGQPYKSRVSASLNADPDLRISLGIDTSDFLEGPVPMVVTYTGYGQGKADAAIQMDLKDTWLFIKPLGFEKPIGMPGTAFLTARLENKTVTSVTGLRASANHFALEGGSLTFRNSETGSEIAKGHFDRLTAGETTGAVDFENLPSGAMKLSMSGPLLDLRTTLGKNDADAAYQNPPLILSLTADRMLTEGTNEIRSARIGAEIDAHGRFDLLHVDAATGNGSVRLRYGPTGGGTRTFDLEADNAGAALAAFGVYSRIQGGRMKIHGQSAGGVENRDIAGKAEISDFRAVNVPVLGRLLGAVSLPGMITLLNGEGIHFTRAETDFKWTYRSKGSLVLVKDGRTSGNSLGLTFDGEYDRALETFDMTGTIVPLSGVNNIISNIPLVGDILTGGSGSVFAATYALKGPAEDPQVSVNPLSVLAPGIVRRILFE